MRPIITNINISCFDNVGIWPRNENCGGSNYESPVVISTKIEKKMEFFNFNLCGPDGTVFIDLDRKVFCALDYFEWYSEESKAAVYLTDGIEGCYYKFYTFSDALTIAKLVENQNPTNKHIVTQYEKQLCFRLSENEIEQELAKQKKNDKESRIVAGKKESYLDLFNRYQSCLLSKHEINKESDMQNKVGDKTDQQASYDDESSEPPKKRQRVC